MHLLFINGQPYSMEELAEAMFMSTSSLKKLITQLNNHDLKPYKLRITYSTPAVKGNELNIRYFIGNYMVMPMSIQDGHLPIVTLILSINASRK